MLTSMSGCSSPEKINSKQGFQHDAVATSGIQTTVWLTFELHLHLGLMVGILVIFGWIINIFECVLVIDDGHTMYTYLQKCVFLRLI